MRYFQNYQGWTVKAPSGLTQAGKTTTSVDLTWVDNNKNFTTAIRTAFIGSSTFAGSGSSDTAHSCVGLMSTWLASQFAGAVNTNRAVGGTGVYNIQPTGTSVPPGNSVSVNNNITYAIQTLNAQFVWIGISANDYVNGVSLADIVAALVVIDNYAKSFGVTCFFTSSKPRNLATLGERQDLETLAAMMVAQFPGRCVDIFFGMQETNNDKTMLDAYDSGDGNHPNDLGHAFIKARMQSLVEYYLKRLNLSFSSPSLQVQYSTDNTNWTTFSTVSGSTTSSTVTGLSASTLYYFRIKPIISNDIVSNTYSTTTNSVSATLIYRETFGNTTGSNASITGTGWAGAISSAATAFNTAISGNNGRPTNVSNVNSSTQVSQTGGYAFLTQGDRGLLYQTTYGINRTTYSIQKFSFYQGSATSNDRARICVQIGGVWYYSNTTFTNSGTISGAQFTTNATLCELTFDGSTSGVWGTLNFTPGSSLSLGSLLGGALPSGNITGFGVYCDTIDGSTSSHSTRIDTVEVYAF